MSATEAIQHVNIIRHLLTDDGTFPNNALLPLLIYQKALQVQNASPGESVRELFKANGWANFWQDGVYDFHHYHSTAHEVLGIISGSARIQFGGDSGVAILVETGDVVIIPAGVAHKAIDVYDDFTCVGAYPKGQEYDMNYGKAEERKKVIVNIKQVRLPDTDPVYGKEGPLLSNWK